MLVTCPAPCDLCITATCHQLNKLRRVTKDVLHVVWPLQHSEPRVWLIYFSSCSGVAPAPIVMLLAYTPVRLLQAIVKQWCSIMARSFLETIVFYKLINKVAVLASCQYLLWCWLRSWLWSLLKIFLQNNPKDFVLVVWADLGFSSFIYFKHNMSPHWSWRVQLSNHTYYPLAGMLARRQLSCLKSYLYFPCVTDTAWLRASLHLGDEELLLSTLLLWGICLLLYMSRMCQVLTSLQKVMVCSILLTVYCPAVYLSCVCNGCKFSFCCHLQSIELIWSLSLLARTYSFFMTSRKDFVTWSDIFVCECVRVCMRASMSKTRMSAVKNQKKNNE